MPLDHFTRNVGQTKISPAATVSGTSLRQSHYPQGGECFGRSALLTKAVMCNILVAHENATVRQVRHDFGTVLNWVEEANRSISKRGKVIALLTLRPPRNRARTKTA
jgi:hypothetical protein